MSGDWLVARERGLGMVGRWRGKAWGWEAIGISEDRFPDIGRERFRSLGSGGGRIPPRMGKVERVLCGYDPFSRTG